MKNRESDFVKPIDATISMKIILFAGNARTYCLNALNAISHSDFAKAREFLEASHTEIVQAHKLQTDCIQDETRGKEIEYSLLFTHAQDTLMTINSEIILIKEMIKIFENYENRIRTIENAK